MAHRELRRKAVNLRLQGKSYSQIKNDLGLSKSTLSNWLNKYPLSREQINKLRARSEVRIEKYRQTMKQKLETKLRKFYDEAQHSWLPLNERELFLAGLFLYWGEGSKAQRYTVSINNTDPTMVKFALFWMMHSLQIPKEKIHVYVHLYKDMNIQDSLKFWSNTLAIPLVNFDKPYIKESLRIGIDQKGFGYGTCTVKAHITELQEKILMSIKAIAEHYSDNNWMV